MAPWLKFHPKLNIIPCQYQSYCATYLIINFLFLTKNKNIKKLFVLKKKIKNFETWPFWGWPWPRGWPNPPLAGLPEPNHLRELCPLLSHYRPVKSHPTQRPPSNASTNPWIL
jgi:hypothetical protein